MDTSPSVPELLLSLMRRPRLDAAAAIAATRLGSLPLERECAIGSPSLDASSTPFNSGIALRSASMWPFNASPFAIIRPPKPQPKLRYALVARRIRMLLFYDFLSSPGTQI